uniref:Uncharacterized protein n=1 Tax=Arion vulgaris TaxID=1028688 RepID=A0A0B6ZTQ0_9EUPU
MNYIDLNVNCSDLKYHDYHRQHVKDLMTVSKDVKAARKPTFRATASKGDPTQEEGKEYFSYVVKRLEVTCWRYQTFPVTS